jgi:DNA-binding transcriptional LysR family regulator
MTDHHGVVLPPIEAFGTCPDTNRGTMKTAVQPSRPALIEFPGIAGSSLPQLLGRLRFKHLALLVALDEHRNLHRAAAAVHMAQPSATKLVHDLERVFGFPLFDRLPTGMRPTEPGAVVLGFARRALVDLKRFANDLDGRRAGRYGHLVIGTMLGAAPDILSHALAEIKRRRPLLSVKMIGEASDAIVTQLVDGHTEIALGYFNGILPDSEVDIELLGTECLYVVARKHHPLCREPRLNLSELERAAWIFQPLTISGRQTLERDFRQAGMKTPANVVESNSISATLSLLSTSDAVTILPESVVRDHLRSNILVRLPVTIGENLVELGVLTRRDEPLSPAATEFTELLRYYSKCIEKRLPARRQTAASAQATLISSR